MGHKLLIPDICELISCVEKIFGASNLKSSDFEALSEDIFFKTKERLSVSTLKRVWGYVNYDFMPSQSTLDVLSIYVGYKGFDQFKYRLVTTQNSSSEFLLNGLCISADLSEGAIVNVSWSPNRLVRFQKISRSRFEVIESHNAKLIVGDQCSINSFAESCPLVVNDILRKGNNIPLYIGAKDGGIKFEVTK